MNIRAGESWVVKKLGGENASEMLLSAQNIINDAREGIKQSVVISAMRGEKLVKTTEYSALIEVMAEIGKKKEKDPTKQILDTFNTTDVLIEIGEMCIRGEEEDFFSITKYISALRDFHHQLIKQKLGDFQQVYEEAYKVVDENINEFLSTLITLKDRKQSLSKENDYTIQDKTGKPISIIGFGEVLSAKIFSTVINELSKLESSEVTTSVIDTSKAVGEIVGGNAFLTLSDSLVRKVSENNTDVSIVPGYVGGFERGIEAEVGRGYSDATAAALAVGMKGLGLNDVTLEVQKAVAGLLSADPRILANPKDAKLIKYADYIFAKEVIGGAKAKLLHDQALRKEVLESGVQVKIFNPFDTSSPGTMIGENLGTNRRGIEFIGGKEAVFFSVSSTNMGGPGILATIFSVVKDYASVDIVSSSETEVSFSIEAQTASKFKKIQEELKKAFDIKKNGKYNFVKIFKGGATIHCVGNFKGQKGILREVSETMEQNGINIKLPSHGIQERAVVFGIDLEDMPKAINALHTRFVT